MTAAGSPMFGRLTELPPLTEADRNDPCRWRLPLSAMQLGDGRAHPDLHDQAGDREGARSAAAGRWLLVGEIDADYLWATFDQSLIAPGTILTVKDDGGRVLISSVAGVASAFQTLGLEDAPAADSLASFDTQPYVTSTWPILLDEVFSAPTWTPRAQPLEGRK